MYSYVIYINGTENSGTCQEHQHNQGLPRISETDRVHGSQNKRRVDGFCRRIPVLSTHVGPAIRHPMSVQAYWPQKVEHDKIEIRTATQETEEQREYF